MKLSISESEFLHSSDALREPPKGVKESDDFGAPEDGRLPFVVSN